MLNVFARNQFGWQESIDTCTRPYIMYSLIDISVLTQKRTAPQLKRRVVWRCFHGLTDLDYILIFLILSIKIYNEENVCSFVSKPDFSANDWWGCGKFCSLDWCSQLDLGSLLCVANNVWCLNCPMYQTPRKKAIHADLRFKFLWNDSCREMETVVLFFARHFRLSLPFLHWFWWHHSWSSLSLQKSMWWQIDSKNFESEQKAKTKAQTKAFPTTSFLKILLARHSLKRGHIQTKSFGHSESCSIVAVILNEPEQCLLNFVLPERIQKIGAMQIIHC